MNSEDRSRIQNRQVLRQLEIQDVNDQANAKTIAEGDVMIAFTSHPGWQTLKQELEEQINGLLEKLVSCHGTIRERESLQMNIKMLRDFITSPIKYIERLKQMHKRKIK